MSFRSDAHIIYGFPVSGPFVVEGTEVEAYAWLAYHHLREVKEFSSGTDGDLQHFFGVAVYSLEDYTRQESFIRLEGLRVSDRERAAVDKAGSFFGKMADYYLIGSRL